MRLPHYTITPAVVRSTARHALREVLPWKPYGRLVTVSTRSRPFCEGAIPSPGRIG